MLTVQSLAVYLVLAMSTWIPQAEHAYRESPSSTAARYTSIAEDIAQVALDPDELPAFQSSSGRVRTALLLASIASFESAFRADVDSCALRGDHGLAVGLWQTHAPPVLVCGDRRTAVRVALGLVRDSFRHCRGYDVLDRLASYTEGHGVCRDNWPRSRALVGRAMQFERTHPFLLAVD